MRSLPIPGLMEGSAFSRTTFTDILAIPRQAIC
jgi:hypothetical protein